MILDTDKAEVKGKKIVAVPIFLTRYLVCQVAPGIIDDYRKDD